MVLRRAMVAGGERGIRTLGRGVSPYNGLANRRLQPLGHLSGVYWRIISEPEQAQSRAGRTGELENLLRAESRTGFPNRRGFKIEEKSRWPVDESFPHEVRLANRTGLVAYYSGAKRSRWTASAALIPFRSKEHLQ
jgi:hypothetical protein